MPTLMTPRDYLALPIEMGDVKSSYGDDEQQFGELFLPKGEHSKPTPVVVLLHGGCWQHAFGLAPLGQLARALNGLGLAVWNLEFRRLGGGGGWPATFLDVVNGVEHLRALAVEHDLDIERLLLAGHSAGGHLALWLAGRWRLPEDCEINPPRTLTPRAVVSLAGIGDLVSAQQSGICRGAPGELVDGEPDERPERYAQASPHALLPLEVPHYHVIGQHDALVPPTHVHDFAAAARESGDTVEVTVVPDAGHFETVAASSAAWPAVEQVFRQAMRA